METKINRKVPVFTINVYENESGFSWEWTAKGYRVLSKELAETVPVAVSTATDNFESHGPAKRPRGRPTPHEQIAHYLVQVAPKNKRKKG